MLRRLALLSLLALGVSSCSSEDDADANTRVGDIRKNDVWKDGLRLTGVIRIFEGATVTIEPGARITCAESVLIQVGGKLEVNSPGAKHARIDCKRWRGILVAQNGQLDFNGLDLHNAEVGIETTKGAGAVNVVESSLLTSVRPFLVRAESKLALTHVKATTPTSLGQFETSVAEVYGSLVAKFLQYDANTNEGIMLKDGGDADIEDSVIEGKNGLDLVSSYGGKFLKLRYSTLKGAHCGPHMQGIGSFELDHVTSEQNIYGITIYSASVEGPHVVKDSNLGGAAAWLDLQGDHGPIKFENIFVLAGGEVITNTDPPTITKAAAAVPNAGPRGPL